jgi:hypothetical protein
MEVNLIKTEGYALEAQVEYAGTVLHVMDEFSPPGERSAPGSIRQAEFSYETFEALTWEETFSGNPRCRKELEHIAGWSYLGYGQIVSVDPVRIDFGILEMEDPLSTHDERCIGEFVCVKIDRLQLSGRAS